MSNPVNSEAVGASNDEIPKGTGEVFSILFCESSDSLCLHMMTAHFLGINFVIISLLLFYIWKVTEVTSIT
jgi:hypothetical protein